MRIGEIVTLKYGLYKGALSAELIIAPGADVKIVKDMGDSFAIQEINFSGEAKSLTINKDALNQAVTGT